MQHLLLGTGGWTPLAVATWAALPTSACVVIMQGGAGASWTNCCSSAGNHQPSLLSLGFKLITGLSVIILLPSHYLHHSTLTGKTCLNLNIKPIQLYYYQCEGHNMYKHIFRYNQSMQSYNHTH